VAKMLGALLLEVLLVDAVVGCFVLGDLIVTTASTGKLIILVIILAVTCLLGLLIYGVLSNKRAATSYSPVSLRDIAINFVTLLVMVFVVGLLLCYTQFIMFNGVRVLFSSLGFFGVIFCVLAISLLVSTVVSAGYAHFLTKKK